MTASTTAAKPTVKVKTVQVAFPQRPERRTVPSDRPVIACSVPRCTAVILPESDSGREWTYQQLRTAARRRKWTKDEQGLDCCPAHPKGHVPEPAQPTPAPPPVEPEFLDGGLTVVVELPPAPVTDPDPTFVDLPVLAAHDDGDGRCCEFHRDGMRDDGTGMAVCCDTNDCGPCCIDCPTCPTYAARREQDAAYATYEDNRRETAVIALYAAHDEQDAAEPGRAES